mmetsp:Transcript_24312/g.61345  ORF Transcript_24312/g.61345 Transcript_24312/m.61345 type:complete len:202 (-) Transcript_24312:253-858(-)
MRLSTSCPTPTMFSPFSPSTSTLLLSREGRKDLNECAAGIFGDRFPPFVADGGEGEATLEGEMGGIGPSLPTLRLASTIFFFLSSSTYIIFTTVYTFALKGRRRRSRDGWRTARSLRAFPHLALILLARRHRRVHWFVSYPGERCKSRSPRRGHDRAHTFSPILYLWQVRAVADINNAIAGCPLCQHYFSGPSTRKRHVLT